MSVFEVAIDGDATVSEPKVVRMAEDNAAHASPLVEVRGLGSEVWSVVSSTWPA